MVSRKKIGIVVIIMTLFTVKAFSQTAREILDQASRVASSLESIDTRKEFEDKKTTQEKLDKILYQVSDLNSDMNYFYNSDKTMSDSQKRELDGYLRRIQKANERIKAYLRTYNYD